jgi:hypothetical protein
MSDPEPRWTFEATVDESVFDDRLARLARRFPHAAGLTIADAWAGLYDMTPDAHPILGKVGDGVYAACGFSGHGFMQSPAVAVAIADEILDGASTLDLSPFFSTLRRRRFPGCRPKEDVRHLRAASRLWPSSGRNPPSAIAEEILDGASTLDLSPYRLERFENGNDFPETVIL